MLLQPCTWNRLHSVPPHAPPDTPSFQEVSSHSLGPAYSPHKVESWDLQLQSDQLFSSQLVGTCQVLAPQRHSLFLLADPFSEKLPLPNSLPYIPHLTPTLSLFHYGEERAFCLQEKCLVHLGPVPSMRSGTKHVLSQCAEGLDARGACDE